MLRNIRPKQTFSVLLVLGSWLIIMCVFASSFLMAEQTSKLYRYSLDKLPLSNKRREESIVRTSAAVSPALRTSGTPSPGVLQTKTEMPHPEFYNSYWPVNCSAIFEDDKQEIAFVDTMLKKQRTNGWFRGEIMVPSDTLVSDFTQDCDYYRSVRDFPTKVLSKEEEEFPLAFIILAHKNAAQVELLFRAIYQPQNVYAFHPDAKSSPEFQRAIRNLASCFDNVFVCSKLEKIKYAGFTRLLADINCMHDLVEHPIQWKYVINQCGEAFPIKTNLEMVQQIKAYNGRVDAESYDAPHKLNRFHQLSSRYRSITNTAQRLLRYPPPGNITLHSGNAYNTLSREFVDFVLTDESAVQFLDWINMTYSPDEHFWASLRRYPRAPGSYPNVTHKDINTSFVKWAGEHVSRDCIGKFVRGICVISTGYLPFVSRQPHLFVNKIHYSYDPVTLQCLQELLTNRTRNPEITNQYFKEFPLKRDWY